MNLLYTLPWHDSGAEENARQLYDELRTATTKGARFPFDCPYEVALAHRRSETGEWIVAILAMRGMILGDAERAETTAKIEEWMANSGSDSARGGQTRTADHLKIASELSLSYEVIESFGTFVGEPGPEDEEKEPEPEPVKPKAAAVTRPRHASDPVAEAIVRAAAATPPPTATVNPNTGRTCLTWMGGGMIALGGLVGLIGLLFALLMAIGQFASESPETSTSEFFVLLACFPLPMLLTGAGLAGIGIVIIYQIRKKQVTLVSPV